MCNHERRVLLLDRHTRAHRTAANAEVTQVVGGLLHAAQSAIERAGVRGELLPKADGHRVLKMRAPRLHDVIELSALRRQRVTQPFERGDQTIELRQTREANIGRNRVVGTLRHVDVIVGVHGGIRPARTAKNFIGPIRQHFVHVHVVRRSRAGLVRIHDKLVVVLAGEHFIRRPDNRVGEPSVQTPRLRVRHRCRLLDPDLRHDERPERREPADREVLLGAHGLHAVERIGGDFLDTEGILFRSRWSSHGMCVSRDEPKSARSANHFVTGIASACAKRLKKLNRAITDVISTICAGDQCVASSPYTASDTMPGVGVIASA